MTSPVREFSVVDAATVAAIVDRDRAQFPDLVKKAYLAFGRGEAINPHSTFLSFSELEANSANRIIALPAYLGGDTDLAGVKWVASFPQNVELGLARASAALILNDATTGYPFACLEGSLISAARTGASAALGAEVICGGARQARRVGFIGTGVIARSIFQSFMSLNWHFEEIHLFDKISNRSRSFAEFAAGRCGAESRVVVAESLASILAISDLIVLATTATRPYITDLASLPGSAKILNISLRDLGPEIILRSDNVVDDVDHCLRANTSVHLAEGTLGSRKFSLRNVYDCYGKGGERVWSPSGERPVVFSPFGLGVLDIAVGAHVYREAARAKRLIGIKDFFFSNDDQSSVGGRLEETSA